MNIRHISLRRFAAPVVFALLLGACGSSGDRPKVKSEAELHQEMITLAQGGDTDAQYRLGYSLCCGKGNARGRRDVALSTKWLCRAAHHGDPRAQYRLGMIYAGHLATGSLATRLLRRVISDGGPPPQPRLAAMWLDLAMASGHTQAAQRRIGLTKKMEADDHVAVEKMRAKWRNAPCEWQTVYGVADRK